MPMKRFGIGIQRRKQNKTNWKEQKEHRFGSWELSIYLHNSQNSEQTCRGTGSGSDRTVHSQGHAPGA
ncbi:mCG146979 [Mus musculus]|nr:mCG146979 [Mus musculus]